MLWAAKVEGISGTATETTNSVAVKQEVAMNVAERQVVVTGGADELQRVSLQGLQRQRPVVHMWHPASLRQNHLMNGQRAIYSQKDR